jgi:hypothetical protein
MRWFETPSFDFIRAQKIAYTISGSLIVVSSWPFSASGSTTVSTSVAERSMSLNSTVRSMLVKSGQSLHRAAWTVHRKSSSSAPIVRFCSVPMQKGM